MQRMRMQIFKEKLVDQVFGNWCLQICLHVSCLGLPLTHVPSNLSKVPVCFDPANIWSSTSWLKTSDHRALSNLRLKGQLCELAQEGVKAGLTMTACSLIMFTQSSDKEKQEDLISALVLWSSTQRTSSGLQMWGLTVESLTYGPVHTHCPALNILMHSLMQGFVLQRPERQSWHNVVQIWHYCIITMETAAFTWWRKATS